jgi:3-keto-L-gulonate-6-phosphate decarboxylase
LDSISDPKTLMKLIDYIQSLGACASPVIETVGTENLAPRSKEAVLALLEPILPHVGMLTFQVAATAARSNLPSGQFAREQARAYVSYLKRAFYGTIQFQGGMTTQTIREAVQLGADFIVCGSQIFRNREGRSVEAVIDHLLQEAAEGLEERMK